jgi:transposase-like protein
VEHCPMCNQDKPGLIKIRVYDRGVFVCPECESAVTKNRGRHYSKVMETFAMLESGYHINRKVASMFSSGY